MEIKEATEAFKIHLGKFYEANINLNNLHEKEL